MFCCLADRFCCCFLSERQDLDAEVFKMLSQQILAMNSLVWSSAVSSQRRCWIHSKNAAQKAQNSQAVSIGRDALSAPHDVNTIMIPP